MTEEASTTPEDGRNAGIPAAGSRRGNKTQYVHLPHLLQSHQQSALQAGLHPEERKVRDSSGYGFGHFPGRSFEVTGPVQGANRTKKVNHSVGISVTKPLNTNVTFVHKVQSHKNKQVTQNKGVQSVTDAITSFVEIAWVKWLNLTSLGNLYNRYIGTNLH